MCHTRIVDEHASYVKLFSVIYLCMCRLDIRKFSFSQRIVNEWNRLSADCVGASSVNIFKNKIDVYLKRAGYT